MNPWPDWKINHYFNFLSEWGNNKKYLYVHKFTWYLNNVVFRNWIIVQQWGLQNLFYSNHWGLLLFLENMNSNSSTFCPEYFPSFSSAPHSLTGWLADSAFFDVACRRALPWCKFPAFLNSRPISMARVIITRWLFCRNLDLLSSLIVQINFIIRPNTLVEAWVWWVMRIFVCRGSI